MFQDADRRTTGLHPGLLLYCVKRAASVVFQTEQSLQGLCCSQEKPQCGLDSPCLMPCPAAEQTRPGETTCLLLVEPGSSMCKYIFLENLRVSNW